MSNSSSIDSSQVIDVAIVGGGISGSYAAWRLAKSKKFKEVRLYEMSDRIGGRLLSVAMPDMPHVYAELGGKYFSDSQFIVSNLVKDVLKLEVVSTTYKAANNQMYLRNKHLRISELTDAVRLPYNLRPNERGKDLDELFAYAVERAINKGESLPLNYFTSEQWQHDREHLKVGCEPLYEISIWKLLLEFLSQEAYNLCLDSGYFYSSDLGNWNAAEAIATNMSIPCNSQWFTLKNGNEQLPKTLAAEFEQYGGEVFYRHCLNKFNRHTSDELIELEFIDIETKLAYPKVLAKHLVLAMPKRSLELLYQKNQNNFIFQDSKFIENLHTVSICPASKLFLSYEYPWWNKLGMKHGMSATDLPIRKCSYEGTESENGGDLNNHKSLLLASNPDSRTVSFWRAMLDSPEQLQNHQASNNYLHEKQLSKSFLHSDGTPEQNPLRATENMIKTTQKQLEALHGIEKVPQPYSALYIDWGKDPYGGGWHSWNPHCKPWDIMKQIRHPLENANVYICGEAYSNRQGWVQGALHSTELMLEENFHLERPEWLPSNYALGA
jgi:lysine 2-monooxygenase